jgi:dTDP-4-dehydrorhamnose reductase
MEKLLATFFKKYLQKTAEYGISKAARPFNSRLYKGKLVEAGFKPLPDWKDAVRRYLAEAEL